MALAWNVIKYPAVCSSSRTEGQWMQDDEDDVDLGG